MSRIILATHNAHKVRELAAMLSDLPLRIVSLDDFPAARPVDEDQPTLEGNALKKAREAFRVTRLPALADDSGLEVFYLNNEPGVFSSRYAGLNASYADNCNKLLANLRGVPPGRRGARFRCVLAFVADGFEQVVEGVLSGSIIETHRGTGGFGYDPIFLPSGHAETLAEMTAAQKNRLSHRSRAVTKMKPHLLEYARLHRK